MTAKSKVFPAISGGGPINEGNCSLVIGPGQLVGFKRCCLSKGKFDGALRHYYF